MSVHLRTLGREFPVRSTDQTSELAQFWRKTLRNRNTWKGLEGLRGNLAQQSKAHLQELCPELTNDAHFDHLAGAGLVEVRLTEKESEAGPAWDMPWEFLLSAATEKKRNRSQPLLVFRHLAADTPGRSTFGLPGNFLVIKNNPGVLGDLYTDNTFLREERNVSAHLSLQELPSLHNEHLTAVRKNIELQNPAVIHVAGIDAEQAAQFGPSLPPGEEEALMMESEQGGLHAAPAAELAPAICAGEERPVLVSLNFVNSASRIAPSIVHSGAGAALAFFNDFDDIVAETFFANFYLGWRLSRWNLLDAFRLAWSQIPIPRAALWGSGVVLWCRESLIDQEKSRRSPSERRVHPARPAEGLRRDFDRQREAPIPEAEERNITVGVKPHSELNYSLLHNRHSLFQYFFIRKPQCVGRLSNLCVDVTLHAGEPVPYRIRGELKDTVWMLQDEVHVPLTSTLVRSVRESIHTALTVHVSWQGRTILERTFRVSLLPVDQWQDDAANRKWLPSFVLPRDPSIGQIVDAAQQYLAAMSDDRDAAFDGYQSAPEAIHRQVSAIWWALINGLRINYTSPPPTYHSDAQRLRSPSAVLKSHRGTCIDLALLVSGCLESIDLYPAVFLLDRHALAGYYRDEAAHRRVCDWVARNAGPESEPWVLDRDFYPKLMEMVKSGEIVPLEATYLTKRMGFRRAIEEGTRRLEDSDRFEYFFDIQLARESGVTPLPLLDSE